ncbi:MAG: hypothetical protein Q8R16_01460 [bacterium]|nr:hypothetical protein [bacterium]
MSFIHNRTGIALCAAAIATVFLGTGCQKQGYQPNSGQLDQGTSPPSDATSALPTKWVEYRNEKLGITIPYPEGWYVSERRAQDAEREVENVMVDFYESEPPAMSDLPAQMSYRGRSGSVAQVLGEFLTINDQRDIKRSRVNMTRVTYPYDDAAAADVLMRAYVWQGGDRVHLLTGPLESAVLEYAANNVEVAR